MVVGQAAGHRLRFLRRPQSDAKGSACQIKMNSEVKSGKKSQKLTSRGAGGRPLTCQEDFELPVVELRLLLGQQAALGALAHRVHEAHAGQRHLPAAAFITEAAAAAPTVVLQEPRGHGQTAQLRICLGGVAGGPQLRQVVMTGRKISAEAPVGAAAAA